MGLEYLSRSYTSSKALLMMLVLALIVVVIFNNTILSLYVIWFQSYTYNHCILIPFISAFLIYKKLSTYKSIQIKFSPVAIFPLLVVLIAWFMGDTQEINLLSHVSLVFIYIFLVITFFGYSFTKLILFPLMYLLFLVPFGDWLIPYLIVNTANSTVFLLKLTGIQLYLSGTVIELTSGTYEVIKACSGIRYLIASVAIGSVFSYLNFNSYKKHLFFMLLSVLVPIIANGLRAYGIVMASHLTNSKLGEDIGHFLYGWVFFGIVLAILFVIGSKFRDETVK